ncbi:MAG: hypothetical protein A2655_00420 [Candidatus Yanofskybacteria bacterium RIFCSPHIGHO2_01_FULL_43_42]|uniref:Uncharacterized protein n=1 Tax=Candidatus Yanofskybacteria bacterium RIFCSPLOWO2_01_FULL_43_22 TaxID=1802695 RepID=A0A1F8GII0_9BACT|nr:MAG: hypothetical protein A2655_00420 [Candidatus Yanofskybacteria bacterium RIFCSPHIGHO2_01_FULL_43_42]OGN13722.1 MAG: hypothetical protein A3D48_00175 [Candidatus Yanofskybacteria bacterium RIFCSPHIGHO2_02_FULL_43_17]OGN24239.1 MAG: hypothetical protein A3A13_03615 [Candidatus Yanofskybacteria bacterium RIFCSPLOWO2_01_FULL_43_22]
MLSPEAIKEYQELYFKKYGEKIDSQTALDLGIKLINFTAAIYRPIPSKEYKDMDKHEQKHQ